MSDTQKTKPDTKSKQKEPSPEKVLSKDTNTALREVALIVQKMQGVFEEETEALKNTDSDKFTQLQKKKLVVGREYQNIMSQMLARKNEIEKAAPSLKEKLKQMQEEFSEASEKNMEAIKRMEKATERLGNTIRNAAIRAAQKDRGYSYGETGTIPSSAKKKAVSSGLSETV